MKGLPPLSGLAIVNKPGGVTSHDVVQRIRKRLATRKVGHLGTLDPMATGVLPVSIGKATRLARFIPTAPKEYTGKIRLGWTTTTLDREGEQTGETARVDLSQEAVEQAMASLTGSLDQIPPAYSAKKIDGVAAHRLARKGAAVELSPVSVEIFEFQLVSLDLPLVEFRVVCSGGTYIRSLARDLGELVGTGAHLFSLCRTCSGPFRIEHAVPTENVAPDNLIPLEGLLLHLARIDVDNTGEEKVRHGLPVPSDKEASPVRIFNKIDELIAIAEIEKGWAHPKVVLI